MIPKRRGVVLAAAITILGAILMSRTVDAQPPFYDDKANLMMYLDEEGQARAVATPDDWQRRREHILGNMQLVMGPLPDVSRRVPLDVQVLEEVREDGFTRRKITFAAGLRLPDGSVDDADDRVPAYLFIPAGLKGRAAAMLCLHQTTAIGKGEPAGVAGLPNLHYARELAERGYVTLAPDYPNYGEYRMDAYARGYLSATMKGIWNHMRAVDVLQSLPEVDPERIGSIGHSLGGHNSLFVAAFDERIKVIVTSCGFNSFQKYMGGNLAGWSHAGYMPRIATVYDTDPRRMPFDFTDVLGALGPRAVFINAPTGDGNFEVTGVHDCINAALPVFELLGAGDRLVAMHPDCGHEFPPETREEAYGFVDRVLGGGVPADDG